MSHWSPGQSLEYIEQVSIQECFKFYRENKTATAQCLGISIRTLDAKLEKYEEDAKSRRATEEHHRKQREEFLRRARATAPQFQVGSSIPQPDGLTQGVHMESFTEISEKQSVPVSERTEVQEVLPAKASASGQKRAR